MDNPVVQVMNEQTGDTVYTIRIAGNRFTPKVFETGTFTVAVGEPGTTAWRLINELFPAERPAGVLKIEMVRREP
jgi:alkaline phosphatase D